MQTKNLTCKHHPTHMNNSGAVHSGAGSWGTKLWGSQFQRGSMHSFPPPSTASSFSCGVNSSGSSSSSNISNSNGINKAGADHGAEKHFALLSGLLSLCCGIILLHGVSPYISIMQDSLPAASMLVSVMHLLLLCSVVVQVAVDLAAAFQAVRIALKPTPHRGIKVAPGNREGGMFAYCSASVSNTWWRAKDPIKQFAPVTLLCMGVFLVGVSAGVHFVNGCLRLSLPLYNESYAFSFVKGSKGQSNSATLGVLLYLRAFFNKWEREELPSTVMIPCLYFVVKQRWQKRV